MLSRVDHLVYAVPDLKAGITAVEQQLGVRPVPGGRHPGWGTQNALLSLGEEVYLEIIAPDPEQPDLAGRRVFGVDAASAPRLVTWAAKGTELEHLVEDARQQGVDLGMVLDGRRTRPDGSVLSWRLTDPYHVGDGGVRPFVIDWSTSAHPAQTAPRAGTLISLRAWHPDPEGVIARLAVLGLDVDVEPGAEPGLVATIQTSSGIIDLR